MELIIGKANPASWFPGEEEIGAAATEAMNNSLEHLPNAMLHGDAKDGPHLEVDLDLVDPCGDEFRPTYRESLEDLIEDWAVDSCESEEDMHARFAALREMINRVEARALAS